MEDVRRIARPRDGVLGDAHHGEVRTACRERLLELGFDTEEVPFEEESAAFGALHGINVIGRRRPEGATGPALLLGAHYDSVSRCDGADDNSSGVAAVLEAARVLSEVELTSPLVVACWDLEEWGLLGARNWARAHRDEVGLALNLESVGVRKREADTQEIPPGLAFGFPLEALAVTFAGSRGDFIALVADERASQASEVLALAAQELAVPTVRLTLGDGQKNEDTYSDLRRSDHAAFWEVDVPAVMITDTAEFRNPHYHCTNGPDAVSDLDAGFLTAVTTLTARAVMSLQQ